jgi:hypothetical protein
MKPSLQLRRFSALSAGQAPRKCVELPLPAEELKSRDVSMTDVAFECSMSDPPLSWHLTGNETDAIDRSWDNMKDQIAAVGAFLVNAKLLERVFIQDSPGITTNQIRFAEHRMEAIGRAQ